VVYSRFIRARLEMRDDMFHSELFNNENFRNISRSLFEVFYETFNFHCQVTLKPL